MHVLMVTPYYFPVLGGTESFIQSASVKLNEKRVPTDILTFNFDRHNRPIWKTAVEDTGQNRILRIKCCASIRPTKIVQVHTIPGSIQGIMKKYDVIHYHNETDLSLPLFSYFLKKPKIMHCHCLDTSYSFYKKNVVAKQVFKRISDIHVAASKSMRNLLIDLGISKSKIRVVPNCVDTDKFRPDEKNRIENMLLFAGRIVPNKGLHVLLESLKHLKTPVKLVIVGPFQSYCSEYYNEILGSISHINDTTVHKVSYLGVQSREALVRLYQSAAIFVCPSLSEPFGIVNLEALSCETPVIASNVGGIPEVIESSKNGLLVPAGKPEALAQAIELMLSEVGMRKKFGKEGREMVTRIFSSNAVASRLIQMYTSLLENKIETPDYSLERQLSLEGKT